MKGNLMGGTELTDVELAREQFRKDAWAGLSQSPKQLLCKYFYDERGAALFEEICELKEYYPTRTEIRILEQNIGEIAALLGPDCALVELGSGSSRKTRLLLDHLERPAGYLPVDVARVQLFECSTRLAEEYPNLEVVPVCADYTRHFELPVLAGSPQRTIVFFPGSTIGNFEPEEAVHFLRRIRRMGGSRGGCLIGVDLKKDPRVLHSAYNDDSGVTAEFNLNLLARANRELDADFDLSLFLHHANYCAERGRIEMRLTSRQRHEVSVSGVNFLFAAGESIETEHSYKYTPAEFHDLAARAGFRVARLWLDERRWFSVQYLTPDFPHP